MYRYTKYLLFTVLIMGLVACGDDSTGPSPEEAPELPKVQNEQAQPDGSFFENNQPKLANYDVQAETSNYYEARQVALFQGMSSFAFASAYSGFLMAAPGEDPVFEDGLWVWEYSYSYENENVSLKLTAEEVTGGYSWAMYWSYDDGQGNSFEDYKMMEGTVSEDGSEGNWQFNSLDTDTNQEVLAYTSEWKVTSYTEKNMTVRFYDAGTVTMTTTYDEDNPEHQWVFSYQNEPDVTLYWNSDTNVGFIEDGDGKRCWDENFQDAPNSQLCS